MVHLKKVKEQAFLMRKKGSSLNEISKKLKIAKSTASLWLSSVKLRSDIQKKLIRKQLLGRQKAILSRHKQAAIRSEINNKYAMKIIKDVNHSKEIAKIYCSLIWWCEGNKNDSTVRFTNSDVSLVKIFLSLLRFGFEIDETKFRALVHLHSYHNDNNQKRLWSKTTKIPLSQFYKSYQKPHTGKRKRNDYVGCIAISYYDVRIAKELEAIYNAFCTIRGVR
ncbi:hypothetical protein KKG52_00090 [Patescibacteria group bacterium]|nr:hypothetical protein [Patescibacteria group bacterium]